MTAPTSSWIDWPALERAKAAHREPNPYGMPYLDLGDPVEFAADQAWKAAGRSGVRYEGIEQAVASVAAWAALSDAQTGPQLSPGDYSEEQKRVLQTLPRPLIYAIAVRAARAAFRAGTEQGMAMNAPIMASLPEASPARKKSRK